MTPYTRPAEQTMISMIQKGFRLSKNRMRQLEDHLHHPAGSPFPHGEHHPQMKAPLTRRHTPHCHPHEEALGPHTNQPGPIRFAKRMNGTGRPAR